MQDTADQEMPAEINPAGVVLSYYRNKYGLTLKQVCDGICSVSGLSRMEQGIRCVDSLTSSQLLERIGKEVDQFEQLLDDADYALWRAREAIRMSVQQKRYDEAAERISLYRDMKNSAPHLHEQFCLYHEILMEVEHGEVCEKGKTEKLAGKALRALHLTKPAFDAEIVGEEQLYTVTEIELILIVIRYGQCWTDVHMENTLLSLFRHVDYYSTERRKQRMGCLLFMELIGLEQRLQDWTKELSYIDRGIDFVSQGREITGLARLHFLRAQALARRYRALSGKDNVQGKDLGDEVRRECLMAYSICEVFGDMLQMREIGRFCEGELGWQITGPEM